MNAPLWIMAVAVAAAGSVAVVLVRRHRRGTGAGVIASDVVSLAELARQLRADGGVDALVRLRDAVPPPLPAEVRDASGVAIARVIDDVRRRLAAEADRRPEAFSQECRLVVDVVRKFPGDEACFRVLLDELRAVLVAPGVPLARGGLPHLDALLRSTRFRTAHRS
ncbi:MAG: hypothetical protein IPK26_27615 [Planctomycetes bacterium]|nr:hypothetical protein [Planctomycetota bacterium]